MHLQIRAICMYMCIYDRGVHMQYVARTLGHLTGPACLALRGSIMASKMSSGTLHVELTEAEESLCGAFAENPSHAL